MTKPQPKLLMTFPVFLIMLLFGAQDCTAQEFEWAKSTLTGVPTPSSIAVDDAGNVYAAGRFVLTLDFDPGPDVFNLTAHELTGDIYIYKLDTDGNFLWAKSIYGYGGDDNTRSLDVSPDGTELYVSGYFKDSADFDPGVGTYILEATGPVYDLFALKLDGDGNFLWAHNTPSGGFGYLSSTIRRDVDGNVLFTGTFVDEIDLDPDDVETFLLTPDGEHATFFQKLDADGDLIWANRVTNIKGNNAFISDDLDIFLTGLFSAEVDFDGGPGEFLMDSEGPASSFVLKLDSDGSFNWVKAFIGDAAGRAEFIEVDLEGNIICSGMYIGVIDADPSPAVFELTSNGSHDHFFIKLDEFGELLWAKSIGSEAVDWSRGIEVTSENEIFISGAYIGEEIDLDPGIAETIVTNFGDQDFYILKLDEVGDLIWSKSSTGLNNESIISTAIDPYDKLYLIGQMNGTVDFNLCPYAEYELTAIGAAPTYILKLGDCEVFGETIAVEECDSYTTSYGSTYTETGTYYEVLTGVCNCDSLITFDVTIVTIDTSIFQIANELTSNEDYPEATYQWIDCNHDYSEIIGETDQVFVATEDGDYAVIITIGACVDTSGCVSVKTQGIGSYQTQFDVSVFPNPTNGNFNIQLAKAHESVDIIIRDLTGKIVMQSTYNSIQSIPMEINEAKGIYFIEIKTDKGEQAFLKIICQ